MKLYRDDHHWFRKNNDQFREIIAEYSSIDFYQPSPVAAPWHWQCRINGILMNFWPHKGKAHIEGERTVEGADLVREKIIECLNDSDSDFEVIDDEH